MEFWNATTNDSLLSNIEETNKFDLSFVVLIMATV